MKRSLSALLGSVASLAWCASFAFGCGSSDALIANDASGDASTAVGIGSPDGSPGASADGSPGASADGAPPVDAADAAPPSCALTNSPPVVASTDGQVIQNLRIVAHGTPGISITGKKNVVVRNVLVQHDGAPGIALSNANGAHLENVAIEHMGAPASGANASSDRNNIDCNGTSNLVVTGARLTRGSSGIYLASCPLASLTQIEGYDFRGPFPRGQLVQFNASSDGVLDGFSVINGHTSWPEDNVNVFKSTNITIRNGLIDGNNAPTGCGVIFDGDTGSGIVQDVDAIHMGDGCFSNYAGAVGNTFQRTRCRDNFCTSQDGRGAPASGGLMFGGRPTGTNTTAILQSKYYNACNGNISWPTTASSFSTLDLTSENFVPRAPIKQTFCWE